jgi:hypothetical protein
MTKRMEDYDAIARVMQLYIDGFNERDINKFREAFHEDAWIFYIDAEGVLHKDLLSKLFPRWAEEGINVVGRLISVTQVGDAASAQILWEASESATYVDFHNLLRIKGVWKITNKTATHSRR